LTDKNFDYAVPEYDYILVLFFSPFNNESRLFHKKWLKTCASLSFGAGTGHKIPCGVMNEFTNNIPAERFGI